MNTAPDIIVVEDDAEIRDLVTGYLRENGLDVRPCDGADALDKTLGQIGYPDLIVLDLMMPGEDGLSICRRLRSKSNIPILFLTAKAEEIDRIVGLELGADDYLAKPFNPRELLARIRAILRRGEDRRTTNTVRVGPLMVDLDKREVTEGESEVLDLTSAEFDLLACFVERPGRVLSRDQLMDWTRGRHMEGLDRTIDVQVSRLRKKVEGNGVQLIKTIRNHGYMLACDVSKV